MDLFAGRYRVLSPLGVGGMGEVALAEDSRLERRVAIKFLLPDSERDPIARERLRREALAAASLDHPFICKVHEIGEADDRTFVVMEYVEGETLKATATRGLLPIRQIIEVMNELAQALEEAHGRGVVHRDLKPSNVMLTKQGHVKVMDFGLAKQSPAARGSGSDPTKLTGSGTRIGTPAYMSPEQIVGSPLDARTDIFSLGVVLHELITGSHPFLREDQAETMAAILRDPPVRGPRDQESVPGLGRVTNRMLAKACAERFQTMSEVRVELEALRERVWLSASSTQTTPVGPVETLERTPFVSREPERQELRRHLDRMLLGQGGLVLIGGEPGIGKTRLARELMREARQRGCVCLSGYCHEMEGTPPFAPFIEMTEQAVRTVPQAVRAAMGDLAPEIAIIVPSLRRSYRDIAPPPDVPAEQQRRLVFSAYLEYVQRATTTSPCVVLLDDLQWADEASLQLMAHVTAQLPSMRMLAVGTYRDVELDVKRPFAKTLETLLRQRLATRISLRRLNQSGVQAMLSAMSGSSPPTGLANVVFRETEGNPFFVEEVYQHLDEEGKLFDAGGRWKENLRIDEVDVPEGVRLVIGRRLDRLGDQARKILMAGAVIGHTFALDLLQAIVDVSEDTVLEAVEEAERAQLVASRPVAREARYEFVHQLIRTTLISGLSLPRRQRLHLKVADALERLRSASLENHASALAHHLYQAGAAADVQRTAKFLALALRRSIAAGAFEEAFETSDQLISLELAEDDPLLAETFEHRGKALSGLQQLDAAVAAMERALALYEARRDDAGISRSARSLASWFQWRARWSEAIEVLNRGMGGLSDSQTAHFASMQAMLTIASIAMGHVISAWTHLDQAVATADRLSDDALRARVLAAKASAHFSCWEVRDVRESGLRALALLRDDELWDRVNLLPALVTSMFHLGRFSECESRLVDLEALGRRAGHHGALWVCQSLQENRRLLQTGSMRAALERLDALGRNAPVPATMRAFAAAIRFHLGDIDVALAELGAALAEQPPVHVTKGFIEANLFAGQALAGHHDRARAHYQAVEPWLPLPDQRNRTGAWMALDTTIPALALLGDRERCAALYPSCVAFIDTGVVCGPWSLGASSPQLVAGIAAHAAGLLDKASEHFEIATRQAHELPHRLLQPTVQDWYGRMFAESPDNTSRARGLGMVEAATADFRNLEMVLHADLAERFLRSL